MNVLTTFDSTKESLQDVVKSIKEGKTQLPDFQRGWVWDDEHIRSLLASVSLAYPIGAVMMLQTGGQDVRFKTRLVEGVENATSAQPERLILDGQQRLTSLFLALYSGKPVITRDIKKKTIKRWYYLDIAKSLSPNGDRDDAIVGLGEDRLVRNFRGEVTADYSTIQAECAAGLLPLTLIYDVAGLTSWQMNYLQADPEKMAERLQRWNALVQAVLQQMQQYQIPIIQLRKETPKEAVCQVFEKVNTGGVTLNVFELLTATFAVDNYHLRDDWEERSKRIRRHRVLTSVENTDFLQSITLLATRERREAYLASGQPAADAPGVGCKRKDILRLSLEDYKKWAEPVTKGYELAAKLLHSQHIFSAWDLPYRTQLVPLASLLALKAEEAEMDGVRTKLARWYWCGVLGELYHGATETRFAKDVLELLAWLDGGPEPSTISDANFAPTRLFTMRTRNSAAYKGISALLLREGALDFRSGESIDVQMYFDDKIDIHHIFPRRWCEERGIGKTQTDCIINKTPLAAKTNRIIGKNAPSVYLARLQKSAGIESERMDIILGTHIIDPSLLRTDNFRAFFEARMRAMLDRIEKAMGKPMAGAVPVSTDSIPDEGIDPEPDETDDETD